VAHSRSPGTTKDPALEKGKTKVLVAGVAGLRTKTFDVTYLNGVEVRRALVSDVVTTPPVDEVVAVGTYVPPPPPPPPPPPTSDEPEQRCDPNYAWACVPIDSDVDCAGGSGDGPSYVQGPVKVIGTDIYRLDNDHDGIGCES
jgi:hypothetical protein